MKNPQFRIHNGVPEISKDGRHWNVARLEGDEGLAWWRAGKVKLQVSITELLELTQKLPELVIKPHRKGLEVQWKGETITVMLTPSKELAIKEWLKTSH